MFTSIKQTKLSIQKGEQITSLAITLLSIFSPILAFPVSLYIMRKDKKNWKVYIFAISMFFASISYSYTPWTDDDLVRYWVMVRNMYGINFFDALLYGYLDSDIPLYTFNAMSWITSKLNDIHLLSAISTFFVYYIALYITCSVGETSGIKWQHVWSYAIFIICALKWYSIANNIRNVLAFAIVGLAVFRDVYQKRRNVLTLFFYVIPIFLHPTSLLFIAIRLFLSVISKLRTFLLVIIVFIIPIVNFAYGFVSKYLNISLINYVINKTYYYLNDTSSEYGLAVQVSRYHTVNRILQISFAAFVSAYYILSNYPINNKIRPMEQNKGTAMFQSFAFVTGGLFTLACASMLTPGYWRFYSVLVIFGGVIFIPYTESDLYKKASVFINSFLLAVCVAGRVMEFYQIRDGLRDIISSLLVTSPFFIFIKNMLNIM